VTGWTRSNPAQNSPFGLEPSLRWLLLAADQNEPSGAQHRSTWAPCVTRASRSP